MAEERTFEASPNGLSAIFAFLDEAAARAGLGEVARGRARLVVEELVINLWRHAFGQSAGELVVRAASAAGRLELELRDAGPAFDPTAVAPAPPADLDAEPGGQGLRLIQAMVDSLAYRREGAHNIVALRIEDHAE
jgi:anti-sigma regulatory factor (Ser/Thr protein kinase)